MDVHLNGEPHRMAGGSTVLDLVAGLGRDPRTVAVELNGQIVRRGDYGDNPSPRG